MYNHISSCRLFKISLTINTLILRLNNKTRYFTLFWFISAFSQQPSLPANQGMRPIQSPRPYTTFELDQIRQYQKRFAIEKHFDLDVSFVFLTFSQQFNHDLMGGIADVYATVRQCGGSHTMTLPFKRQIKTQFE